jgi:predicted small metal-binding protein
VKLACEGCDWDTEAETADELHAVMMAHGAEAHSNLLDGKSPDVIQQMEQHMDAHVRHMIAD